MHLSTLGAETVDPDEVEEELRAVIEAADVGELDGTEHGAEETVLFLYSPDAAALWAIVHEALRKCGAGSGYAVIRFGGPGADELKIEL